MRRLIFIIAILVFALCGVVARAGTQVNVTQEHNNPSRDGVYIDSAFTPGNAASLVRDLGFDGTISGNVYAQPLYIEGGPNGPMIIAVTESNNVYALDATTGASDLVAHRYWSARPNHTVRRFQSHWHHWHAGCRSHFPTTFLRRVDQRQPHQAFHLFVGRGQRRYNAGLAGGPECNCYLQRYTFCFAGAGTTWWHSLL